ncbi:polynucleotide adenylyltransferase [Mesotoga sp. TolDC]|nr:polynucleotide adenylyltransferase [Mesotoga sp. TolDC]
MKVITTHRNPDFDAFASAVAAQKLYPDHVIVFGGQLVPTLKGFLSSKSLLLSFYNVNELKIFGLSSLIIVDTSDVKRIPSALQRMIGKSTQVRFFDHHKTSLSGSQQGIFKELGACTTLLCNQLRKKKKEISRNEATLFAAAIYRETGNFTHASTKAQDLRTAAWLIDIGAQPDDLGVYSSYRLSSAQQRLVESLILGLKSTSIRGVEINMATAKRDSLPAGFSLVVEKLWSFLGVENLVVLLETNNRVYFTLRSRYMNLDTAELEGILRNGGGSYTLGFFEDCSLEDAEERIMRNFEDNIDRLIKVREIMSSPVRTVLVDMKVEDVFKIMQRTGHHTLPVVDREKIVGISKYRDIEKAMRHGLSERRIVEVIDRFFVTASADDSVQLVTDKMVENDTTAILILDNGILSGIVTRTDLLKSTFGRRRIIDPGESHGEQNYAKFPVEDLIEERTEKRIVTMLRFLGAVGSELNMPTYIVGGFVRDLLLNKQNLDLDIVVEGNANAFAETFKKYFSIKIVEHREFLASSMFFNDGLRIDVATARTEYYKKPAMLPEIEMSTIKKDLYRRDFSINAMAIKLNQEEFGILIDFFGSRKDLSNGVIRALHPLSFIEDPTRILRAVRFEQRFGFEIEVRTAELLKQCVAEGYLDRVTGQRLRDELIKTLDEPLPLKALRRLSGFGATEKLFPQSKFDRETDVMLDRYFSRRDRNSSLIGQDKMFYSLLMIMLRNSDEDSTEWCIERYGLTRNFLDRLTDAIGTAGRIVNEKPRKPSQFHSLLRTRKPETLNFVDSHLDDDYDLLFLSYLKKSSRTELTIDGNVLKEKFGMNEGPEIREVLDGLFCARLDGLDEKKEDEFVREYLKGRGSK